MRTITTTDDKQLWRIPASPVTNHRSWPIYATPATEYEGKECYLIESAIPIENKDQWNFVDGYVSPNVFDSDGNKWLLRPSVLEGLFLKCKGCTPEFYKVWGADANLELVSQSPENVPTPESNVPTKCSDPQDSFIRYCCNHSGFTNLPAARLMFKMFIDHAIPWMLEKHEPLDLGFCTLYALPLRANWKSIQSAKYPEILSVFRKGKRTRNATLEASGFLKSLHATSLVGMDSDNTFGWTLEVVQEKPFDRAAEKMERKILEGSPVWKYVMRWSRLVSAKSYEKILTVFGAWLEKAAAPSGHVDTSVARNLWRLSPQTRKGRVRPVAATPANTAYSTAPTGRDEPTHEEVADASPDAGL